jgi:hypothetical protein
MDSGDGRTKHRHRRWRIFSRFPLSNRLHSILAFARLWAVGVLLLGEVDFMVEERGLGCCGG